MGNIKNIKIVLVGAGNIGHHLGLHLLDKGLEVIQIYSRKKGKAKRLAKRLRTEAVTDLKKVLTTADLYIIAVKDNAISTVAEMLSKQQYSENALFVHTSGATPSTVLKPYFKHYGIFYPLQTFSIHKAIDFQSIPICIDAKYVKDKKRLTKLGERLSDKVFSINDKQRTTLHVAAVFVNNFSNLMYTISKEILEPKNLSFDLLRPLLLETAMKVQTFEPKGMQTGPAIRADENTLNRHLLYLKEKHPEYYPIYLQLTEQLFPGFKPEGASVKA